MLESWSYRSIDIYEHKIKVSKLAHLIQRYVRKYGFKVQSSFKISKFSYFLSGIVGRRIEVEENWEREKNIDDAKCKCFEAEKVLFCLQTKKEKREMYLHVFQKECSSKWDKNCKC